MKHDISIQDHIFLIILSGGISPREYGTVAKDLVNLPQWKPGMPVLIDYSYIDLSKETGKDAQQYVQAIAPFRAGLGNGRLACVNTNPADFGLGRIWQSFMELMTDLEVGIFYTYDEAVRWLTEPDQ